MKKINLVVITAFTALVGLSTNVLADPPRISGPTQSGKTLDEVREQEQTKQREDAKFKKMKRLVAKKYGISVEEVDRRSKPTKPRKPRAKKVNTGSVRQRGHYGDRFRSFNLPGYIGPDPRRLRPLDR